VEHGDGQGEQKEETVSFRAAYFEFPGWESPLYISSRPGVVNLQIALAETAEPPILYEVVPEPAVKDEITSMRDDVAFPPYTPCSLEPDTGIPNIDRFAERFGRPELHVEVSNGKIENIQVIRGSPCGATWEAAEEIEKKPATRETVNTFALRACHRCAAPRFGRLETKDLASYFHAEALARALGLELNVEPEEFHAPI
jgi:hypothetical protein